MVGEFKIRKGVQRGTGIVCAILILLLLFWGIKIWVWPSDTFNGPIVVTVFITCLIIGLALFWFSMFRNRLLIEHNRIVKKGILGEKELLFNEIKGITLHRSAFQLESAYNSSQSIYITSDYENFEALQSWAIHQFNDLDIQKADEVINELAEKENAVPVENKSAKHRIKTASHGKASATNSPEETPGRAREKVLQKISRVKPLVFMVNTIAVVGAVLLFIGEKFYPAGVIICAILPLLAIIIFNSARGLIAFNDDSKDPRPGLFISIFIPVMVLFLVSLGSFNVIDTLKIWIPALFFYFVFIGLFIFIRFEKERLMSGKMFGILVMGLLYAYGLTVNSNWLLDTSSPQTYKVRILDKRVSGGKHYSYYIHPERWGTQAVSEEAKVSKAVYDALAVGDSATIYLYQGFYNIRHYSIVK